MDAFGDQIVELLPRLRRFARTLARSAADADDLVQAGVERALARRSQWRPGTRLDAWMFAIMRNAWIDEMRRRARTASGGESLAHELADPAEPGLEARFAATAAERALADLPEDQRTAVVLVLIEGFSYREAAEALDIPEGTLTSRLSRGRAALAAVLLREAA